MVMLVVTKKRDNIILMSIEKNTRQNGVDTQYLKKNCDQPWDRNG
jgi:hypothetical protein